MDPTTGNSLGQFMVVFSKSRSENSRNSRNSRISLGNSRMWLGNSRIIGGNSKGMSQKIAERDIQILKCSHALRRDHSMDPTTGNSLGQFMVVLSLGCGRWGCSLPPCGLLYVWCGNSRNSRISAIEFCYFCYFPTRGAPQKIELLKILPLIFLDFAGDHSINL